MTPPQEMVAKLKRYDPQLRLRWGVRTNMWYIERLLPPLHHQLMTERPNPWKSDKGKDLYDGWKEGYVHVLTVHPSLLDDRVFEHLAEADTWRVGGMTRFSDRLDRIQADMEAEEDRGIKTWQESAARETHDILQWNFGNRMSLARPEPALVDTGMGFKLRDRRQRD